MPVSAQEHRVRTGLYSSCKGVWLFRHKTKHFSPTTETRSRREVTEYDTFDLQIIGFFVTVMLLVPLMYTAFVVTMTILEVLLQIRLSTDKGAVYDVSHQARLDLSWVIDVYHLVIKICFWLVQHRRMVTLFSFLCVFLISTVTAVVCLIIRHRYKQTLHRVVIVLQGAKMVDVRKVSTGHSSQRLMCVSFLVAILTAIIISLMLIKSGDVESNPGPITGIRDLPTSYEHRTVNQQNEIHASSQNVRPLQDSRFRSTTGHPHTGIQYPPSAYVQPTSMFVNSTPANHLECRQPQQSPLVRAEHQQPQAYPQDISQFQRHESPFATFHTPQFPSCHSQSNHDPAYAMYLQSLIDQNVQPFQSYRPTVHPHTPIHYPPSGFSLPLNPTTPCQSLLADQIPIQSVRPRPPLDWTHTQPQQTSTFSTIQYNSDNYDVVNRHVQGVHSQAFTTNIPQAYPVQSQCDTSMYNPQQLFSFSQPLQYPHVATSSLIILQTPTLQVCEQTSTQHASSSTCQTPSNTVGACSSLEQPAGTTVSCSLMHSDGLSYSTPQTCSQLESMDVEYPQEHFNRHHSSSFESQQVQTQYDVTINIPSLPRPVSAKRQSLDPPHERCPEAKKTRLTQCHPRSITEDGLGSQSYPTTSTDGHTHISNTLTGPSTSQQNSAEPPPLSFPTDFSLVFNDTLYPVRSNWYNLGLALKLLPSTLESIKIENREKPGDCLRDILLTRMKKMPKLTWKEVIECLRQPSVGERELALRIERKYYGQTSSKGDLLVTDPASNPPECVVRYASYLKDRYKQMSVLPDDDWPPPITSKQHFTNLALIERKRQCPLPDAKLLKTMEYDYAHGNVDNIVDRKQSIEFEQVFLPIIDESSRESRLTILMDGAPGVGKTTITRKVCIDWANGKILQEYQLVIFVPLREVTLNQVENHTITDLLPADDPELKAQINQHIQKSSGTNTMFLFDGFDELSSPQRTRQSLFLDIIKGNILHHCSVLVTSRSYASGPLKDLNRVNRHVEVLGFDKKQIKNCIKQNVAQKDKADQLLQMLKDRLDISSLCYIPLNCRIVLYVYSLEFTLPDTLTQLYDVFILHTMKHHARKIAFNSIISVDIEEIRQAKDIQMLPDSVQSQLDNLSQIAFSGMQEDKLVFEYAELKNSKDTLSLGLLNSIETFTRVDMLLQYYQFLHLTIQEFLAARYIASDKMSAEERLMFLKTNVENERFRMTLLFLAGLTYFDFLPPKEAFPGEKTIDLTERSGTRCKDKPDKEKFLFLAQLYYETRASSCDWLLSSLCTKSFNMSRYSLTQFDCLVLVHFLSTTPQDHIWEVIDLHNCNIISDRFRILSADHTKKPGVPAISMTKILILCDSDHSTNRNVSIVFDLIPPIISEGTHLVTVNLPKIKRLSKKQNDCSDALKLAESLVKNESLQKMTIITALQIQTVLHLSRNELTLTGYLELLVCPKSFQSFLKCTTVEQLEVLRFSQHPKAFQDCPHCGGSGNDAVTSLCQLIDKTTNLQNIDLSKCELSGPSLTSICTSLAHKTTLKSVDVDGNIISEQDIGRLVKLLPISTKLTLSGLELTVDDQTHLHVRVHRHGLSAMRELLHHNKSIVVLNVRHCGLNDAVLKEISDYLSHKSSLRELDISYNEEITSEGWEQFIRALQHNTSLKQLNIKCSCSLTSGQRGKVVRALSEMITHNKGISELTIDEKFINYEYELFARALLQNTTLQLLRVLTWSNVQKRLTNEIKRLRQEEGIIVSPDWNLKIV